MTSGLEWGRQQKRTHFITRAQFSPEGPTSYFGCTKCCCRLLRTLIFNPPLVPPISTWTAPSIVARLIVMWAWLHLYAPAGRTVFSSVLHSPPSPRTPALIASDHQYVAAADVSLLNLRREHNQPHLLQFFLSTGGPPPRRNHLCSRLSLCGKPPYPRAKKSHNSYSS